MTSKSEVKRIEYQLRAETNAARAEVERLRTRLASLERVARDVAKFEQLARACRERERETGRRQWFQFAPETLEAYAKHARAALDETEPGDKEGT